MDTRPSTYRFVRGKRSHCSHRKYVECQEFSTDYFSPIVPSFKVKSRIPADPAKDIHKVVDQSYRELRALTTNLMHNIWDTPGGLLHNLKILGVHVVRNNSQVPEHLIKISSRFPAILAPKMLGYLTAITSGSQEREQELYKIIMKSMIHDEDQPQFVHLLDEISYGAEIKDCGGGVLIELVLGSLTEFTNVIGYNCREPPIIEGKLKKEVKHLPYMSEHRLLTRSPELPLSSLQLIKNKASKDMMSIVTEGFATGEYSDDDDITKLMQEERYQEVISLCSAALERSKQNEMIFNRTMALMKLRKYPDAINECNALIKSSPSVGKRLRASLWRLMGLSAYARIDEAETENTKTEMGRTTGVRQLLRPSIMDTDIQEPVFLSDSSMYVDFPDLRKRTFRNV